MPPRSLRRLLHPENHRALEHATLHGQLGNFLTQLQKFLTLRCGQFAVAGPGGFPGLGHPVAQGALVDAQIPSDLSDRLAALPHDTYRAIAEGCLELLETATTVTEGDWMRSYGRA